MKKNFDEFKIKTYGRTELAQMYFPNIGADYAWKKLRGWIDGDKALLATLRAYGYCEQRTLSPRLVKIIVEKFGEPF